jgi:hypothetical protein
MPPRERGRLLPPPTEVMTVADLKNGLTATHALLPGTISPSPAPEVPSHLTRPRTRPPSKKSPAKSPRDKSLIVVPRKLKRPMPYP